MKTKTVITVLFVAFTLSSCTPVAKVVPTETAVPTSTFTPVPPTPTVTPTPTPENIADSKDLSAWVDEFVHAYGGKVTVNGMEMNEIQLTNEIRKNGNQFTKVNYANGSEYSFIVVNGVPLAIREGKLYWQKGNISSLVKMSGGILSARQGITPDSVFLDVATQIKLDVDMYNGSSMLDLYNRKFDWNKVLQDWGTVEQKLLAGTIPYRDEVFNQQALIDVHDRIRFANEHDLTFAGGTLFYPSILGDPELRDLAPERQILLLKFLAAAKLIEFPEIQEIDLCSELIAYILWGPQNLDFASKFNMLGGITFLKELADFSKEISPNVKLSFAEDLVYYNYPEYKGYFNGIYVRQYNEFFKTLENMKQDGVSVDMATIENNLWIYAEPDINLVKTTLGKILAMGYDVGSPDTLVTIGQKHFYSPDIFPQVTPLKQGETPESKKAIIYQDILQAYLESGINSFGLHSVSMFDTATGDAYFNIIDEYGKPRESYYSLMKVYFQNLK
jgi:hypothetical protein